MNESEFHDLLARYFAGQLDEAGSARLQEHCRCDAAALRELSRLTVAERALGWLHNDRDADLFAREVIARLETSATPEAGFVQRVIERLESSQRTRSGFKRILWARLVPWAAAAAAIVLMFSLWFFPRPKVPPQPVAMEWLKGGAVVADGSVAQFSEGQRVRLRNLSLTNGTAQFRLDNGILISVTGPANVELIGAMRMRVAQGKITADVGKRGRGFVVETARGNVVDLGTEFGVDVELSGAMDVVVFKGSVEVQQPSKLATGGPLIASLERGEAVRLDKRLATSRVGCVFVGAHDTDWATQPVSGAVITDVSDNLTDTAERRFYRVEFGGMSIGTEARHRHGRRWFPAEGGSLPEWLVGADVVRTFAVDMKNPDFEMTLTLARRAVVYVFHDARQTPPDWLIERFTNTGVRLRIERADSLEAAVEAPTDRPFTVWKSATLPAGPITLGPPRGVGQPKAGTMYGVAAKALP